MPLLFHFSIPEAGFWGMGSTCGSPRKAMCYAVPISDSDKAEAKGSRKHHEGARGDKRRRMFANFRFPGACWRWSSGCLCQVPQRRAWRCWHCGETSEWREGTQPHFLAVSEGTVKTWENGTRFPSVLTRRCIQVLPNLMREASNARAME